MSEKSLADTLRAAIGEPTGDASATAMISIVEAAKATEGMIVKAAADAVTGERTRLQAILGSEDAKGREAMASHLAFATDMTAEAAVALLKVSPQASGTTPTPPKAPTGSRLDQAMIDFKVSGNSPPPKSEAEVAVLGLSGAIDDIIARSR